MTFVLWKAPFKYAEQVVLNNYTRYAAKAIRAQRAHTVKIKMTRTKLQSYFLATGFVFLALFVGLVFRTLTYEDDSHETSHFIVTTSWTIFRVSSLITSLLLAAVCFHISSIRASKYHTLTSILMLYILNKMIFLFSGFAKRKIESLAAKDPRRAQEELLISRMKRDANTLYGKRHKFSNIRSLEDLRINHPLTSYDYYEEYIQQMAEGEENILVSEKLVRFGITSGTTGKGKLIPLTKSRYSSQSFTQTLLQNPPGKKYGFPSPLQKDLMLYVNPIPTKSPGGYVVGPMHLFTDDMKLMITQLVSVPWEAMSISTEHEAHYLALLFGLRDPDIGRWMGPFSSQVHKAMSRIEKHWKQLVHDIKTGTIDKDLKISAEVRDACENLLSPEPERAEELRREFEKGFVGIMLRVWPHLRYIFGINTADFTQKLKEKYAKGVPIVPSMYSSTEGDYGINLWCDEEKYALIPDLCIFEFVPEENINETNPKTLFIDEVKKGEIYEMIVSPVCGFYRYRFGDVIKVVDFYCNVPVVKFMYRSGQLLNLRAEKVTELSVDEAVQHMVTKLTEAKIAYWTAAENTLLTGMSEVAHDEGSQFYLIFIELEDAGNRNIVLNDEHQQQFDAALQERNNLYRGYRKAGTISPPRVYLVKPGTFKALQDYIVANSTASYNQFKVPSKLKTAGTLKLMLDNRS